MSKAIVVTSKNGSDSFTSVEQASVMFVEDKVVWSNGEEWQAPYTDDELQNIYDGEIIVTFEGEDESVTLVSGCTRAGLKLFGSK